MSEKKLNGNIRSWHFDSLETAWHQPQTSVVDLMQLSRAVLSTKNAICNVRN